MTLLIKSEQPQLDVFFSQGATNPAHVGRKTTARASARPVSGKQEQAADAERVEHQHGQDEPHGIETKYHQRLVAARAICDTVTVVADSRFLIRANQTYRHGGL
jgi:hypothetical protein